MDKINKRIWLIIILVIIILIVLYQRFMKGEDCLEIGSNTYILSTNEENNLKEDNLLSQKGLDSKITIYITGAVMNEGVYELEENSRIADSIEAAGGVTNEADLRYINLAYILEDGVKIYIPKKGESINSIYDGTDDFVSKDNEDIDSTSGSKMIHNSKDLSGSKNVSSSNSESRVSKSDKVNINTATQSDLESLPGIGPSTALKIIEYRKEKGKFNNIEDIKKVSGIGDVKYSKIKDLIKT